jgi:hypothetical protein
MEKKSTWQNLRPKIIEILITAAVSALLAFLQSLITHIGDFNNPTINPEVAGGIGASLQTIKSIAKIKFYECYL